MDCRRLFSVIIIGILASSSIGLTPFARAKITKTVTLNPIADSYVATAEHANDNYGGKKYLNVRWYLWHYAETTYIMFDLQAIPSDATLNSAVLKLRAVIVRVSLNIGAYYCSNNTWMENEINWNNRPSYAENATDIVLVWKEDEWYSWDVTDDVKKVLSSGKLTMVLKSEDAKDSLYTYIRFASKDYGWYTPELKISYTVSTPEPTPIPPIANVILVIIILLIVIIGVIVARARAPTQEKRSTQSS